MKRFISIVLTACILAACYSKDAGEVQKTTVTTCLRATVWDTNNLDCHLPVLSFSEDSIAIHAITGNKDVLYIAKGLPDVLNIKGKKICVKVAKLSPGEEFPCTMLGLGYPHIKVVSAAKRE